MGGRRTIFITGAASGIGLATARRFAGAGWFVGLADIDVGGLDRAQAEIGAADCSVHRMDVRDPPAWDRELAAFATATDGRLDVLLNNAGIGRGGLLDQQSEADVDAQIDINLKGVINGCRAGVDLLRATPGSTLVNVASVAGLIGSPGMSVYAATKFGVRGLSEALEHELAPAGVAVRCIMPWFIDTPILDMGGGNERLRDRLTEQGTVVYKVEAAADAIWDAVHGKAREHMVGAQARRIRFLKRWFPGLIDRQLRQQALAQPLRLTFASGWPKYRPKPRPGAFVRMGGPLGDRLKTSLLRNEPDALDRLAKGAPLALILEELLIEVEAETSGGMLASILLLDEAGEHLLHGAAPSLPQAYNEAIHGIAIGPGVGSCGTAAYLGHPVYVTDIATDPLWKDFRDLALGHGLKACWSTPIEGPGGKILGTFALYHRNPRSPTPDEVATIAVVSKTAATAIELSRRA